MVAKMCLRYCAVLSAFVLCSVVISWHWISNCPLPNTKF